MKHPIRLVIIAVLLSSSATIMALRWDMIPGYGPKEGGNPAFAFAPAAGSTLSSDEETNIRVYNQVSPGVVNITQKVLEYDFFFSPVVREGGTGSGCVLDTDGNILTNYHVIETPENRNTVNPYDRSRSTIDPLERLEVSLPDGTKYHAKVVGVDKLNDLSVIRLVNAPKSRLHPISLGESGSLKVGQKVLAIGNPLGLQNTLTTGIISSTGRKIRTEAGDLVENVIQTDAAINPGNSGGPLLNTAGEMIGINSSIFTIGGGNIGIGFAIPVNTIRRVATELIRNGRVTRPWFGVEGYTLNDDLASALGLPVSSGILVARVYRGSSAESGGIRGASEMALLYNQRVLIGGDIITQINGQDVDSMDELQLKLEGKKPGDTVQVTIYRGKAKSQKTVNLVEAPRQRTQTY